MFQAAIGTTLSDSLRTAIAHNMAMKDSIEEMSKQIFQMQVWIAAQTNAIPIGFEAINITITVGIALFILFAGFNWWKSQTEIANLTGSLKEQIQGIDKAIGLASAELYGIVGLTNRVVMHQNSLSFGVYVLSRCKAIKCLVAYDEVTSNTYITQLLQSFKSKKVAGTSLVLREPDTNECIQILGEAVKYASAEQRPLLTELISELHKHIDNIQEIERKIQEQKQAAAKPV